MTSCGHIVVLNGPSRSGKSSIAAAVQEQLDGVWMNLGMDLHIQATPPRFRPGVGLRPQLPEHVVADPKRVSVQALEDRIPALYAALYESVAAHARLGFNVVVDVYHHDFYTRPLGVLADCARRLAGLPVLFVGVHCPVDVIWERRKATWGQERDEVTTVSEQPSSSANAPRKRSPTTSSSIRPRRALMNVLLRSDDA